jgi:hypothetical protein
MFNSDTFANRPAFGIVGRIFISTDTKEFFRDTGTSWELIGGPGSGTITGSGAATQVAFWNSASTITGSNNLFWDSTNNYLGISTNTPTTALDVHHSTNSGAIFNQTTATNNNTINFQTSGSGRWRIGNFYTAGADDFGIFDVVGSLQQLTILKTTGQTFIGAKTTASGRLVVNSATADAHLQIVGANAPSIRIDNAGSGGTQRFVFGLATATNNFIQGATAGEFCISTQSAGNMLFGMWQTINASEVMRISTSNNLLIGSSVDGGQRLQVGGSANITGSLQANTFGSISTSTIGGPLNLNNSIAILNITQTAYLPFATRNTTGIQVVYDLSNVGSIVASSTIQGTIITATTHFTSDYYRDSRLELLMGYAGSNQIRFGSGLFTDFLAFYSGALERMRITTAGNILVNSVTDNGNRLQIEGNQSINLLTQYGAIGTNAGLFITSSSTTSANGVIGLSGAGFIIQGKDGASTAFPLLLQPYGSNVLIGTTTNGASKLRIVGLPTSAVGLSSGDVYSNAGILTIVP